jgi:hypothetical protein
MSVNFNSQYAFTPAAAYKASEITLNRIGFPAKMTEEGCFSIVIMKAK